MGLPFASGHYLAFRDFPASSFSPAYLSVWHRDPGGDWTFYATTPGPQSCSRYFSSATPVRPGGLRHRRQLADAVVAADFH